MEVGLLESESEWVGDERGKSKRDCGGKGKIIHESYKICEKFEGFGKDFSGK